MEQTNPERLVDGLASIDERGYQFGHVQDTATAESQDARGTGPPGPLGYCFEVGDGGLAFNSGFGQRATRENEEMRRCKAFEIGETFGQAAAAEDKALGLKES